VDFSLPVMPGPGAIYSDRFASAAQISSQSPSAVPARMTPQSMTMRYPGQQPGTPTYSPTEDIRAPATPVSPLGVFQRASASSVSVISGGRGDRSPTYIVEEAAEEPLPPTPTYTGSSPTYLDELEPPTPTLDPDDDELYGQDDEAVTAPPVVRALAATPGTPPGTFGAAAPGTPPDKYIRLPGMESPTPTYEPDDEDYPDGGGGGEGPRPPFAAPPPLPRGSKRAHDGTTTLEEAAGSGTPLSGSLGGSPQLASPLLGSALQGAFGGLAGIQGPPVPVIATHDPFQSPVGAVLSPTAQATPPLMSASPLMSPGFPAPGAASSSAPQPARAEAKRRAGGESDQEDLPPWKRRALRRKQ